MTPSPPEPAGRAPATGPPTTTDPPTTTGPPRPQPRVRP
jgi:hypothetical protein